MPSEPLSTDSTSTMTATKGRRVGLQFSLRALLLGIAVVAAGLWWWTWPKRTADQFIELMATAPEQAEEMSPSSGIWNVLKTFEHDRPYYEAHPRTLRDMVLGRQVFTVVVPTNQQLDGDKTDFIGTLFFTRGTLKGPIELDSRAKKVP